MRVNPQEIIAAANKINNILKDGEKFALPLLAVRAKKAALANPENQGLRMLYNVFSKMSENGKVLITRAEFVNIFNKFAATDDEAGGYFRDELGKEANQNPERELAGGPSTELNLRAHANEDIIGQVEELWDKDTGKKISGVSHKLYNKTVAKQAQLVTNMELTRIGVDPKSVDIFAGSDNVIICNARYDTAKGETNLLIPVEISKSGALIPTTFITRYGFVNLAKGAVDKYINLFAGRHLVVDQEALLTIATNPDSSSVLDEFQLNVLAMKDSMYKKPEGTVMDMPESEDVEKFASKLSSAKGTAEFLFGKDIINNGRNIIASKVSKFGYKPQVSVRSCDDTDNTITYAVKIDAANGPIGFEVMAEINNGKVIVPAIIAVADKAYDFTKEGMESMVKSNSRDYKTLAVVSPLYELKTSEILENIKAAADKGDFKTAEDALTVLAEREDREAYMNGMAEYFRSVSHAHKVPIKTASTKGCPRIIKTSNCSEPVCSHLNLPISKVYQNERGECVPLYRKQMGDTYEGILFNTSKVFI